MLKLSTALAFWLGAQAFELDCQKSACPEMCMCSSEACSDSIGTCLDDGDCASVQDCAMTCGCGDDACLLQCAAKTTSPFAVPVAECIKSKCPVPSLLKASVSDAECGAAACKEACECSNEQCHDEVHKCLDDPECAKVQACAMDCNCGDDNCLMSCVEKSNSPLAPPVAECVVSKCHVATTLLGAPNLSCHGASCEDSCKCAKRKCLGPGLPCLLDPKCASFQACSFKCACGDADCALACAKQTPSAKAMPLASCVTQKCHSHLNI